MSLGDSHAVTDILNLALSLGTVGYRIGWAKTPFFNKNSPKFIAVFSSPTIIGNMWVLELIE